MAGEQTTTLMGAPQRDASPQDVPSLTSLRAGAALLVFGYHLRQFHVLALPLFGSGDTGVAFFFVLSGFLLTWGYSGRSLRGFYVRRVARIVPSHLVTWAVALLLLGVTARVDWFPSLVNALLLQAWVPTDRFTFGANPVAWSLSCEIAFYAVLPVLLAVSRRWTVRRTWLVALGAFAVSGAFDVWASLPGMPAVLPMIGFANPVLRLPEFLLGIAAAKAVRSGWLVSLKTVVSTVLTSLVGFGLFSERPARDFWLTPVFLMVILLAVRFEGSGRTSVLRHPWLVYAGKISFAFYLVQEIVLVPVADAMGPGFTTAALTLALMCVAAAVLHHAVELPAQILIVRRFGAARATTPSNPVSLELPHSETLLVPQAEPVP